MLFRLLISLSLLFVATQQNAQVPEVELVEVPCSDPFMPDRYYRTKYDKNPLYKMRKEKKLSPEFTGQFISIIRSKERLISHPSFAQFGNIEIFISKDVIHYGIPAHFASADALDSFLEAIVSPRSPNFEIYFMSEGREDKEYRSYMQY